MSDPTDTLAEQILADARKQAEPIGERAEREAEAALRKATEEAEREREGAVQRAQQSAELGAQRIRARAGLEVENIRRRATEQVLLHVRDEAMKELTAATGSPQYHGQLRGLVLAALRAMSGERFKLVMRAEDRDAYGKSIARAVCELAPRELGRQVEIMVSDDTIRAAGGLLVGTADGRQVCDQTFEARLERLWPQLRQQMARDLLPDPEEGETS